jgi:hypothetical protein
MVALASQSLSVVVSLIPYIREFIRRHLTPKQAVMLTEFDKLKRVCLHFMHRPCKAWRCPSGARPDSLHRPGHS